MSAPSSRGGWKMGLAAVVWSLACGGSGGNPAPAGTGGSPGGNGGVAAALAGGHGGTATGGAAGAGGKGGSIGAAAGNTGAAGRAGAATGGSSGVAGAAGGGAGGGANPMSCPTPVAQGSATSLAACSIAPLTLDTKALCGGAAVCPITAARSLQCEGFGFGPWLTPGTTGASVLVLRQQQVPANTSTLALFTMGTDPAADRVESLPSITAFAGTMTADAAGTRTIFSSEPAGIQRLRETAAGWTSDQATIASTSNASLISAGRAVDETHAFAATYDQSDWLPRLATRDGACWHSAPVGTTRATSMGMDIDTMKRPWVAWTWSDDGYDSVSLAGPDGTVVTPYKGTTRGDLLQFWDRPQVLAGGLSGAAAHPLLATQRVDGLHLLSAEDASTTWTDHLVPGAARQTQTSDCPSSAPETVPSCHGRTTCSTHATGAFNGFGLVRTANGRVYAGWVEDTSDATYTLGLIGSNCPVQSAAHARSPSASASGATTVSDASPCVCGPGGVTAASTVTLALGRVTDAGVAPDSIRRFQLLTNNHVPLLPQSSFAVAMAARGNTLLVLSSLPGTTATFEYFEIDSAVLP